MINTERKWKDQRAYHIWDTVLDGIDVTAAPARHLALLNMQLRRISIHPFMPMGEMRTSIRTWCSARSCSSVI